MNDGKRLEVSENIFDIIRILANVIVICRILFDIFQLISQSY